MGAAKVEDILGFYIETDNNYRQRLRVFLLILEVGRLRLERKVVCRQIYPVKAPSP
ncbi:hypothetical protein D3C87_502990 [compost metagenome]